AARPSEVWSLYSGTRWRLPPQVGTFEDVHDLVELALAAMDGMQIRMFREPPLDLETQWARAEKVLFPSPIWDGFRGDTRAASGAERGAVLRPWCPAGCGPGHGAAPRRGRACGARRARS